MATLAKVTDPTHIDSASSAEVAASGDLATTSTQGMMSAADKTKLNGLAGLPDAGCVSLDGITGIATIATSHVHLSVGELSSVLSLCYAGGVGTPTAPLYAPNSSVVDGVSFDIHGDVGARVAWAILKE